MANNNSKNKTNNTKKAPAKKNTVRKTETNVKVEAKKVAGTSTKKVETKNTTKSTAKNNNPVKKEVKEKVTPLKENKVVEKKDVVQEANKKAKKEFKLSSKERDIILILLVVVLLIVAAVVTTNKTPKFSIELPVALEGTPGFNEITYSEYEEKMAEEKPFLVAIVQDGCGYCEMFKPVLEETAPEYNIPIYYINMSKLTREEYAALEKSNSYLRREKWGTPTTLLLYGNNVIDSIDHYVEKEELVEFIKENIKVD